MKRRIVTALFGVPLLVSFIWFDTRWFPLLIILVAAFAVVGAREFYRLGVLSGARPLTAFGIVWCLLFIANAHFEADPDSELAYFAPSLLASAVALPLVWLFLFSRSGAVLSWAWTVVGILYVGWLLGHYVSLRELDHGREWVILAAFSTFACDTAALLAGRAWGSRPLAPRVSPGKTWEGAIAGFVGAVAAAFIIDALLDAAGLSLPVSYAQTLAIGCLVGAFAQIGDLVESLVKRRAGAKDSGSLLPGHGGVLDRMDSLVFTGAVVYYYVTWLVE
jgi:phosphatidate cytidylyltransferase